MPEKSLKPMASSEALAFVGDETSAVADQKSLRGTEPAAPGLLWNPAAALRAKAILLCCGPTYLPFVLWPDLLTFYIPWRINMQLIELAESAHPGFLCPTGGRVAAAGAG